jgi:hypothetical protein
MSILTDSEAELSCRHFVETGECLAGWQVILVDPGDGNFSDLELGEPFRFGNRVGYGVFETDALMVKK